jgi:hypothetical protein
VAFHAGHLLWDRISCPSNFSIFFCGRAGPLSSSADALHPHLTSTECGGLTDKDIDRFLREERYLPTDVNVCAEQIQSFRVILSEIFGETTPLPHAVNVALCHIIVNTRMYEEMQASNQNFLTMFCFKLDLMVQIFLRSCCDTKSREYLNEDCLTVQPFLTAVMDFIFQVTLPEYLRMSPKREHGRIIRDISSGREKIDSDQEEKCIQNPNVNNSLICKANENCRDIFSVHSAYCPKEGGKPIYMRFFIRGFYVRSCTRSHTMVPTVEKEMNKFVVECWKDSPHF